MSQKSDLDDMLVSKNVFGCCFSTNHRCLGVFFIFCHRDHRDLHSREVSPEKIMGKSRMVKYDPKSPEKTMGKRFF